MVTRFGLAEGLSPLAYSDDEGEVFLGHTVTQQKNISSETARQIDRETRAIIDRNYQRAERILEENREKLHAMAEALMCFETI